MAAYRAVANSTRWRIPLEQSNSGRSAAAVSSIRVDNIRDCQVASGRFEAKVEAEQLTDSQLFHEFDVRPDPAHQAKYRLDGHRFTG